MLGALDKDMKVTKTGRKLFKKGIAKFNLDRHVISAGSGEL